MTTLKRVHLKGVALVLLLAIVAWGWSIRPTAAGEAQDAQQLVDKARLTVEAFVADKDMGPPLKELLKKARGVLIYPQVLRGAFIVGVFGGSGVFVVHDAKAKKWVGPAFYTIGEASFGLQAGGDASEVVLVALTDLLRQNWHYQVFGRIDGTDVSAGGTPRPSYHCPMQWVAAVK